MGNGLMGKVIRVNLSDRTATLMEIPLKTYQEYWGGAGLGTKILWDQVKKLEAAGVNLKEFDAFSPDNLLVIGTGPGTGITGFPSPGRHHVMMLKSPLTGSIGSANSGGEFGALLKKAGIDMLVIEGKADGPVYLEALNGTVTIKDAGNLWGKTVFETDEQLKKQYQDVGHKISVACIGPPGEKLAPIAGIMNDAHRAAGRTGVGAVMGSKKLKAIVTGGTLKVETADPEKFKELSKSTLAKMKENPVCGTGLPTYGTAVLVNVVNNIGSLPVNNWQFSYSEKAEQISGETLTEKYLRKRHPCWGCSIACGRATKVDEGPFKIAETEGPEYESIWAFGSSCGVYDMPAVIMANHYCDEYGIDTISAGSTVAAAMELAEKGYIPPSDYEGLDLKFGSSQGLVDAIKLMGKGEGFGKKLIMGSHHLANSYGHPELSMTAKKLEMPAYDPRGVKGIGLNYATANRGGCHVTGYTVSPEVIGLPEQIDRLDYGVKPTWVKIFQDFTAAVNSTVNCLFTTFALGADDFAALMTAVTGWNISAETVLNVGERIYNLQRVIMEKLGVVAQDFLPKRLSEEPLPEGPSKGEVFKLDDMLKEYYKLRGWDERGVPTAGKLSELGID
ncbi:MAG: aldehyde ferredoxin oxidoreductase [Promethearchaeia archaeon]|nr:MAG: aldehyde ferredoxin oxidoreductase [Candidatus Lokiarchaeia archaeon]